MAILISKFRIDYSDLIIITDANDAPKTKTHTWFENMIRPFRQPSGNGMNRYSFIFLVNFNDTNNMSRLQGLT